MTRARARSAGLLLAIALAPALCAGAWQGTALAQVTGGQAAPAPQDEPGDPSVRVTARRAAYYGSPVRIRGAADGAAGRRVSIEARDESGAWTLIAAVAADESGAFRARWEPPAIGRFALRAVVSGASSASADDPPRTSGARVLTVYRRAMATWYGPGFFGRTTACGIKLTRSTEGVAHRRLPCGTQVEIAYRGRVATVPVIDRGPYVRGIKWDLTHATAVRLGFETTSRIGSIVLTPAR